MSKIIISIGTSLLQNLQSYDHLTEIFPKSNGNDKFLLNLQRNMKKQTQEDKTQLIQELLITDLQKIPNLNDTHLHIFKNITSETDGLLEFYKSNFETFINNRKRQAIDYLPAEISSLYLYYYNVEGQEHTKRNDHDENNNDQIILLCTDTVDSVFCAKVIKEIILKCGKFSFCEFEENEINDDQFYFKNGIAMIKNLDVYNQENWRDGLSNLNKFFKNLRPITETDIIIRTGGYKEFSTMMILLSFQYEMRTYYLFEDSIKELQSNKLDNDFDFEDYIGKLSPERRN